MIYGSKNVHLYTQTTLICNLFIDEVVCLLQKNNTPSVPLNDAHSGGFFYVGSRVFEQI